MTQPQPIKNNNDHIADLVIEDLVKRKKLGEERDGIPLQAFNGKNALVDAYEDVLDLAQYIRQEIEKNAVLKRKVELADKLVDIVEKLCDYPSWDNVNAVRSVLAEMKRS